MYVTTVDAFSRFIAYSSVMPSYGKTMRSMLKSTRPVEKLPTASEVATSPTACRHVPGSGSQSQQWRPPPPTSPSERSCPLSSSTLVSAAPY